ncbi:hypothetical protein ACPB9E_09130 [Streptomyces exfoliatus]
MRGRVLATALRRFQSAGPADPRDAERPARFKETVALEQETRAS